MKGFLWYGQAGLRKDDREGGMHRGVVTGHRRQWMVDSSLGFRNFIKVWF